MSKNKVLHIILSILAAIVLHIAVVHPILDLVTILSPLENVGAIFIESCMVYEVTKYFFQGWTRRDKVLITINYIITVLFIMFVRPKLGGAYFQLNPFALFRELYYGNYYQWMIFFCNIVMFIPLPYILGHRILNKTALFLTCFMIGVFLELLQTITHRGIFDLGDILLYSIGIIIGMIIRKHIFTKQQRVVYR